MRTPAKNKVSKLRNLFERPVGDKFKSVMVKGGKNKKGGGGEMAASIKQQLFSSGSNRVEHYVSTSDQEEEFTSFKPRNKRKYTLAVKQPGVQGKEGNMATLEAIAVDKETRRPPGTPKVGKVTVEKRPRETESDSEEGGETEGEMENNFIKDIKKILEDGGAGHMFGPIKDRFQQFVDKLLKKQATKIKAEMVDISKKEKDLDKCPQDCLGG